MSEKKTKFNSVSDFANQWINPLRKQLRLQESVLSDIRQVLPDALTEHVTYCVINGKRLLLYTDNAIWASQLRFYSPVILDAAKPFFNDKTKPELVIKINKEISLPSGSSTKVNIPSIETIEFLKNLSQHTSDSRLQRSLAKLCMTLMKLAAQDK